MFAKLQSNPLKLRNITPQTILQRCTDETAFKEKMTIGHYEGCRFSGSLFEDLKIVYPYFLKNTKCIHVYTVKF